MLRPALLLILLLANALPVHGQGTSPREMPLTEQLAMNYYAMEEIAAALPGFGGFDRGSCVVHVYLTDPAAWGDSARALFRHTRPGCDGPPQVTVHAARYTWAETVALRNRLGALLWEPELRVRGRVMVHPNGTVTVYAQNRAALERAHQRLLREPGISPDAIVLQPPAEPEEVDEAPPPPRAAYLAVLDSVAAHVHAGADFGRIDPATLPGALTVEDLRARGLRLLEPSAPCASVGAVRFGEFRLFSDGAYTLKVLEGTRPGIPNDFTYSLHRDDTGRWRVFRAMPSGDLIVTACPADPPR